MLIRSIKNNCSKQARRYQAVLGGDSTYVVLLICASLAYLVVGLWLRNIRWINPDEGAHIADAVLLLDGKLPVVDFPSRQPLYVLFLAVDLFFMGHNLIGARVAPLVATILTGIAVYFLIRLRFDASYAFAGCLGYLLLPLNLALATVVKMEPFALALGTAAAVCCIAAVSGNRAAAWLFSAGLLMAATFYVRESTAYALGFASLGTFVFFKAPKYTSSLLAITWLSAGLLCGFLLAFGLFAPRMGLAAYFQSPLNPISRVLSVTERLYGESFWQQPIDQTLYNIRFLINSHKFLLLGSLLGIGSCLFPSTRSRYRADVSVFCALWLAGLIMIYTIRGIQSGIYPSYGREFTVPAIVLTLAGVRWLWNGLKCYLEATPFAFSLMAAIVALQLLLVAGQVLVFEKPRFIFFISLLSLIAVLRLCITTSEGINASSSLHYRFWAHAAIILCAAFIIRAMMAPGKRIVGPDAYSFLTLAAVAGVAWLALRQTHLPLSAIGRATGLIVLVSSTLYSLSSAGHILDRRFDNVWSPAQLAEVTRYLEQWVPPDGTVLSGANIWPIEAGRKLFGDVTHPLGLRVRLKGEIGDALRERPPGAIVLDGYTEKTYGLRFNLGDLIKRRYSGGHDLTMEGESRYPVVIHRLNERRLTPPPDLRTNAVL